MEAGHRGADPRDVTAPTSDRHDEEVGMRLARRQHEPRRDPDHAAVPRTVLVVLTALLILSWGVVRLYRIDDHAAARKQQHPLSVVVRPPDDPSGQHVAPGCGEPQPGAEDDAQRGDPAERRSGSCIVIWTP